MIFTVLIFIVIFCPPIAGLILGAKFESVWSKIGCWIIASAPFVLFCHLALLLNGAYDIRFHFEDGLTIAACAMVMTLWALIISGRIRRKKVCIPFLAVCLCFAVVTGIFWNWQAQDDAIPKIGEYFSLHAYDPDNEENLLATLDEPAALQLTENLPIIDGATAMYPVYAAFAAETYPEDTLVNPEWFSEEDEIDYLQCSTTTRAYENLAEGEVDVIFAAGPSDEQIEYATSLGQEFVLTPIGREGFVFFVNSENPIDDLSVDQLRGIYSDEITKWEELGAGLGKIRAFQRDEGSGSQTTLVRFMGDMPLMDPPTEDVTDGMLGIIEQVADYKNYKNAIGYSFRFYSTEMVKNDKIKLLSVGGVAPTTENIAGGSYPLGGEFYAVKLVSNENPNVDALIEWALSEQGQELIEKTGYVPLG